jgi:hypothetical protein
MNAEVIKGHGYTYQDPLDLGKASNPQQQQQHSLQAPSLASRTSIGTKTK